MSDAEPQGSAGQFQGTAAGSWSMPDEEDETARARAVEDEQPEADPEGQ